MRVRYTKFDERFLSMAREQQLRSLFLDLLMHTGGNVRMALDWLDEIANRHGFWPDGMDIEKFQEMMVDEGYISPESRPENGKLSEASKTRYKPTRRAERAIRTNAF